MSKRCFLVSPISTPDSKVRKHSDKVMMYLLKPVCKELDYELIRCDLIDDNTKISEDVFRHLDNDELVIADITGNNPNVFFEIGYRYAKNLPVILICDKDDFCNPFDIYDIRTNPYGFDVAESHDFMEKLKRVIITVEKKSGISNCNTFIQNNAYMPKEHITILKKLYHEYLIRRDSGKSMSAANYFGTTEDIKKIIEDYPFEDLDTYLRELGEEGYLDIQTADLMVMITKFTRKAFNFCETNFNN